MPSPWDTAVTIERADPDEIVAAATVPHDSPYFDGHFPDNPVVPGIAMLAMVEQAVALGLDGASTVGFFRVRFRKAVDRGGRFDVTLSPNAKKPERYNFRVTFDGDRACEGQVLIGAPEVAS